MAKITMDVTKVEAQILLVKRKKTTYSELGKQIGLSLNVLTRYFNGGLTKQMQIDQVSAKIDRFLSDEPIRVNPEINGGGE